MSWFDRLRAALFPSERVTGDPPSGNGASSFHLWWDVPPTERLVRASVVLEVIEPRLLALQNFRGTEIDPTLGMPTSPFFTLWL